jgi:hypothetical protein
MQISLGEAARGECGGRSAHSIRCAQWSPQAVKDQRVEPLAGSAMGIAALCPQQVVTRISV